METQRQYAHACSIKHVRTAPSVIQKPKVATGKPNKVYNEHLDNAPLDPDRHPTDVPRNREQAHNSQKRHKEEILFCKNVYKAAFIVKALILKASCVCVYFIIISKKSLCSYNLLNQVLHQDIR